MRIQIHCKLNARESGYEHLKHHEIFTVLSLSVNAIKYFLLFALSEKINQAIFFSFQVQLLSAMLQAGHYLMLRTLPKSSGSVSSIRLLPRYSSFRLVQCFKQSITWCWGHCWCPLGVSPLSGCCPGTAPSGWYSASGRSLPDVEDTADVLWEYLLYPVAAQIQLLQVGTMLQAEHYLMLRTLLMSSGSISCILLLPRNSSFRLVQCLRQDITWCWGHCWCPLGVSPVSCCCPGTAPSDWYNASGRAPASVHCAAGTAVL